MTTKNSNWLPRVALAWFMVSACSPVEAQPPPLMNFQGRLLDGVSLVNGPTALSLRLFNASAGGTLLYEDSNTVTVVDGNYSTLLGDDTTFGSLNAALTNAEVWLEIRVAGVALTPRERVASVGYALLAAGVGDNAINAAKVQNDSLDFDDFADGMDVDGINIITIPNAGTLAFSLAGTGQLTVQREIGGTFATFEDDGDIAFGLNQDTFFMDWDVQRVGLGLINPSERLTVNGNIAPSASGAFSLGNTTQRWSTLYLASEVNYTSALRFVSGVTTGLTLSTAGNVSAASFSGNGVGLTNVNADLLDGLNSTAFATGTPLYVESNSGNGAGLTNVNAEQLDGQDSTAFAASVHVHDHGNLTGLADDDHPQYLRSDATDTYNPTFQNVDLRVRGTNATILFLDASQNSVGIGTESPSALLEVSSTATDATAIVINNSGTGGESVLQFKKFAQTDFSIGVDAGNNFNIAAGPSLTGTNTALSIDRITRDVTVWKDLDVQGTLTKNAGAFRIDHPLEPATKYLYHSFVESPDMMNVYNGIVALDVNGEAWVEMPDWFEALNRDPRYQLTCIGSFSPVYVSEKMNGNRFKIAGGMAGLEVSWQVTGIRQDRYADDNRIPLEEDKLTGDRNFEWFPASAAPNLKSELAGPVDSR